MRHIENWDDIQERQEGEYASPAPGGYEAVICVVEDREDKQYLEIWWDFLSGPFQGSNQETHRRAGFWPTRLFKSYKDKALPFFKSFCTAVEKSNPGYRFNDQNVLGLLNKHFGVVLGEEEYRKNDGSIGKRLYVHQVRSIKAIQDGDYKVPALKRLGGSAASAPTGRGGICVYPDSQEFQELNGGDDENLPF